MITKPHEREKILKNAKKFFTDGIIYSNEKLLIGSYQLIKAIAKNRPIEHISTSLTTISKAISKLNETDAKVIRYRFMDNFTMQQAATLLSCSRERIRQRQSRALTLLNRYLSSIEFNSGEEFEKRKKLFIEALKNHTVTSDDISIESLHLSSRTLNSLKRHKIYTASQLFSLSNTNLLKLRNLGPKCVEEIRKAKLDLLLRLD